MHTTAANRRSTTRWLVLLFVVAAGLRVGWVAVRYGPDDRAARTQFPDEDAYVLSARSLAAGGGLIDEFGYRATYMPGYPAFLAMFQRLPNPLLSARLVQALLAALVAPATFLLARMFLSACGESASTFRAAAAGLLVAFDPFLLFFSGLLLTEVLFATVLVSAWALVLPLASDRASPGRSLLAGVLLLIGVLLRPAASFLVPVLVLFLVLSRRDRRSAISAAIIAATVAAGLLPWAWRNHQVVGRWAWLTTRGGISLYDGLQPGAAGGSDLAHTKIMPQTTGLSETQWDDYFREQALAAARSSPGRVLALAGRKFLRTWSPLPHAEGYRGGVTAFAAALWTGLILAAAVVGWWTHRRCVAIWVLLLLPVFVTTAVHMVFVGSVRYRVPVMPMLAVLAGAGIARIWMRMEPWRHRGAEKKTQMNTGQHGP